MFGIFNYLLSFIGIKPIGWLTSPQWALPSVISIHTWQWTSFAFLVFLAALQSFDPDVYEAAEIDGAKKWQVFRYVTLPLLRPSIVIVAIFRLTIAFRAFGALYAATEGGPGTATETLNLYTFTATFKFFRIGYGAALGATLFCLSAIFTIILLKFRRAQ